MSVRPNEDRWALALSKFVDEQEGIGGSDVHCVERSDDGRRLRFTPTKMITNMSESVFALARATFGPALSVSQQYDTSTRSQRLYFEVHAPTDAQAREMKRRYDAEQSLLRAKTLPLWLLVSIAAALLVFIAYTLHCLHHHWEPHEDATLTLREYVRYHTWFFYNKLFS